MTKEAILSKEQLRREMLGRRDRFSGEARRNYSEAITGILLSSDSWKKARVVMSYMSFGSEVDTLRFNAACLQEGKILALPKVEILTMELSIYSIADMEHDLEAGRWGIREPRPEICEAMDPERVDFILVPGVAFDLDGGRIGYGKGFYDRFIGKCQKKGQGPLAVGASFGMQMVERIPLSPNDRPVDAVVTENGWHWRRPDRRDGPTKKS